MATQAKPHILIEGRIPLTEFLWHRCRYPKPIILSTNWVIPQVSSLRAYHDEWGDGTVARLFGAFLIMGHRKTGADWIDPVGKLETLLDLARKRFGLGDDPVRIVCAGSHESLWAQEHGGQAGLLLEQEQEYLAGLRRGRQYAAFLYEALNSIKGIEFEWAATAFPHLKPRHDPYYVSHYAEVAGQARQALIDETPPNTLMRTIPRLYTRERPGAPWKPFEGGRPKNGRGPYTTTGKLLEQYRVSLKHGEGHECVLTKLLPRDIEWLNPCDCPLVTLEQREQAAAAGVSAILLDHRFGVIEPNYDVRPPETPRIFAL